MFTLLKALHHQIPKEHLKTLYALCFMVSLFSVMLLGQLLTQLFPLPMMPEVSGMVVDKHVEVTSYIGEGRSGRRPVYSLILTLNDGHSYNIELNEENQNIGQLIYKGGKVKLYLSTTLYNILSLDIVNHGLRAVQVEFEGHVLDSFASYQRARLPFIVYTLGALIFFIVMFFIWYRQVVSISSKAISSEESGL